MAVKQTINSEKVNFFTWMGTPIGLFSVLMIHLFRGESFNDTKMMSLGITAGVILLLCYWAGRILYSFSDKKAPAPALKDLLMAYLVIYVPTLLLLLVSSRSYWVVVVGLSILFPLWVGRNKSLKIAQER